MFKTSPFLALILLCVCLEVALAQNSKNPIAAALENLKEHEKEDFLSYVLGLGILDWAKNQPRPPKFLQSTEEDVFIGTLNIADDKIQKFKQIEIPPESRIKLLKWTRSEFNLSGRDVIELIRTKKCQGPNCISLADLGPLCCPW